MFGQDKRSIAWIAPAHQGQPASYVALQGANAAALATARTVQVSTLGPSELRAIARERPAAFAREAKGAGRVRLLGTGFALRGRVAALKTPATMSFLLPHGTRAADARVLLAPPGGGAWVEAPMKLVRNDGHAFLRGDVKAEGIYALARLEP